MTRFTNLQDSRFGRTSSALSGGVKSKCLKMLKVTSGHLTLLDIGHKKRAIFKTSLKIKPGRFL